MQIKNKRIALIGPNFFSYTEGIRLTFLKRGIFCVNFDERHSNSIIAKILYRLQIHSLFRRKRNKHLEKIFSSLVDLNISDVFLINTEAISSQFIRLLNKNNIKVHLYLWDSIQNKKIFLDLIPYCNSLSSFEPADCKSYNMAYIPLFAEDVFMQNDNREYTRKNNIVISATMHSRRLRETLRIEDLLINSKYKLVKLLYYHSYILYLIKCLFNPGGFKFLKYLSTSSKTKKEIAFHYFRSKYVLDIHHPGQFGLTSRTFESLRSGAYLITSNPTYLLLPEVLKKRVIYVNDYGKLGTELSRHVPIFSRLPKKMDYFLSLDRFVDDLINLMHSKR